METQQITVGSRVVVTGGEEYHFQPVGSKGKVQGMISDFHLSVSFKGGPRVVVMRQDLALDSEVESDNTQLQELLKEAIRHIQSISALYKAELVFNSDHENFYRAIRLSEDFADRALRFATLEVKPHE